MMAFTSANYFENAKFWNQFSFPDSLFQQVKSEIACDLPNPFGCSRQAECAFLKIETLSYNILLVLGVQCNNLIHVHIASVCFDCKIITLISVHGLWNHCPYFVVIRGNVRQISGNNRVMIPNSSDAEKKGYKNYRTENCGGDVKKIFLFFLTRLEEFAFPFSFLLCQSNNVVLCATLCCFKNLNSG